MKYLLHFNETVSYDTIDYIENDIRDSLVELCDVFISEIVVVESGWYNTKYNSFSSYYPNGYSEDKIRCIYVALKQSTNGDDINKYKKILEETCSRLNGFYNYLDFTYLLLNSIKPVTKIVFLIKPKNID
jgi:hypothetical protein